MPRYDRRDIMLELLELYREMKSDTLLQLSYYRASVYKQETKALIEQKVRELKTLCELIGDTEVLEAFDDYERVDSPVSPSYECRLTLRLSALLQNIEWGLSGLLLKHTPEPEHGQADLALNLIQSRAEVLALCRQGSRPWAFFSKLR